MTFLSHAPRMIYAVSAPNPWQRAWDDWSHVQILRLDIHSTGRCAETRWLNGEPVAVVLDVRLNQRERRSKLAHELEHLERGQPCGKLRAKNEHLVIRATAEYLLPDLDALGATLAIYDLRRAAWELNVTHDVLIDRLNGLTENQSTYVHSFREDIA